MEKMTWSEAKQYLRDFNKKHGITTKDTDTPTVIMAAVISQDSFIVPYSLESRTYLFANQNKAFLPNMGGYSIFACAKDGSDPGVRLERYIDEEGVGDWKVDYCYIEKEYDEKEEGTI